MTTTDQALAAAADGLARIDHALAVQDATDFGDGYWLPGDPLYDRPRGHLMGEQHIRPLFQVIDDGWVSARCEPCQVTWAGPDPCWVCGTDRPRHGSAARWRSRDGEIQVHLDVDISQAEAALARVQEQMREFSERVTAQLDEHVGRLMDEQRREQRWSFLPAVADPAAPAVDELAAAVPLDGTFASLFVRPEPEPVLDERLAAIDPAEHRDRPVAIREQDPDDTVTRTGFFGRLTLGRPRYPRPEASDLDNQENQ